MCVFWQAIDDLLIHNESRSGTVWMQVNANRRKMLSFCLKTILGFLSDLVPQSCKRKGKEWSTQERAAMTENYASARFLQSCVQAWSDGCLCVFIVLYERLQCQSYSIWKHFFLFLLKSDCECSQKCFLSCIIRKIFLGI